MIAITTSNSISVKPRLAKREFFTCKIIFISLMQSRAEFQPVDVSNFAPNPDPSTGNIPTFSW